MDWLNFHHLRYFWVVARSGSVTRAADELNLAQPTISAQIKDLEDALGVALFERVGRQLHLTDMGRIICDYADEIFSLGREVLTVASQKPSDRPLRLRVGITNSMPKMVACELLEAAMSIDQPVHMICHEGNIRPLVGELAAHRLDMVLCDSLINIPGNVKTFNRKLGVSDLTLFASPKQAARLKRRFPESLHGVPALLPTSDTHIRSSLDQWFVSVGVQPNIVAEFDDSALMKVFGRHGHGFFAAHTVIADDIMANYDVKPIERLRRCRQTFHAISVDRRHKNPAVTAITETAKSTVFR